MIKRNVLFTSLLGLIAIDQCVKIAVFLLYMDTKLVLIPNVLIFRPVQNKNLNYLGSLLEIKTPLALMILLEIVGIVTIIMSYKYCLFLTEKRRILLNCFLYFGLAGISGAFIDNVFWGGSIDFIQLFDWFIFDIKDVYLCTMSTIIILYMFLNMPEYNKLNKYDKKKYGFIKWIANGCPAKPTTNLLP